MRLDRLKIQGFRNLDSIDLSFDSSTNVHAFVGENGQGKTNLLESIYLCALSKSFRSHKNQDLIGFKKDYYSVVCHLGNLSLEVIGTNFPPQKTLKVNGLKKRAIDFMGHFKAIFFSPDDLAYMAFAPRMRRRYLDVLLSQLHADYLLDLSHYESARRQRNSLLKLIRDEKASVEELSYWDKQLATFGLKILEKRKLILNDLESLAQIHYQAISKRDDHLALIYSTEIKKMDHLEGYLSALSTSYHTDIASGNTQLGPHRDDLSFFLNDVDMRIFASRGEWRSLVLSLKFAEIELLTQENDALPILLLDDVFSELDASRQRYLFDKIGDIQTFVTTTHSSFFEGMLAKPQFFSVEGGMVLG